MNNHCTASLGGLPVRGVRLFQECWEGDAKLVAARIQAGDDVNETARDDGRTPMHNAVEGNFHWATLRNPAGEHADVVRLLIEAGADINTPNKSGLTPLDTAFIKSGGVYKEEISFISALIEAGATVGESDTIPLHWAAQRGQISTVAFLISAGHPVNQTDKNGVTALHLAAAGGYVEKGHMEVVDALLNSGVDINHADAKNRTPLDFALEGYDFSGYQGDDDGGYDRGDIMPARIISRLIKKGARVNLDSINRRYLLHLASAQKEMDFVFTLVKAGVDVHLRNENNKTAADIAEQRRGRKDTIAVFLREVENRQAHNERQEAEDMLRQLD